jgi:hypothetical protein
MAFKVVLLMTLVGSIAFGALFGARTNAKPKET